jgi:branched-chain amino acid transport system permease protein
MTPVQAARAAERARRWREPGRWLLLGALAAAALAPLAGSFQVLDLAAKIAIFAALAASYDIVLGYTGIVSFGHAMFFGLGAYAVALGLVRLGPPTYGTLVSSLAAGAAAAAAVAVLVGVFSLRVKAIFFAMITLAVAEFALILAVQLSGLTGGEDGLSPHLPGILAVGWTGRLLGVPLSGRLVTYAVVLTAVVVLFLLMHRFVDSPLGRTLRAVRDNPIRAEALGYRPFAFQVIAATFASVVAALLGGCYALWVRYVNPESTLGVHLMLDVLLMVVIGGVGTLWGGVVGAAVLLTAQTLLPNLRALGGQWLGGGALAGRLTERWLIYFGILFIVVVFFFPRGILGSLRQRRTGGWS